MTTVIYADVLVALNIIITYMLIVSSRLILKTGTKKLAVLLASVIGGAFSLTVFFEDMGLAATVALKLFSGALIAFIAFLPKSVRGFLKSAFAYFGVSFLFGGVMYFLCISVLPGKIIYKNGTVYCDIGIAFLTGSLLVCFGLLNLGEYLLRRRAAENVMYTATVYFQSRAVSMRALYDTGNSLSDGVSGKPVVIVTHKNVKSLFSAEEALFFGKKDIAAEVPATLKKRVRIIPCSSVSGDGVLLGFTPDKLVIKDGKNVCETDYVVIAVTDKELASGEYGALLNSAVFERCVKSNAKAVK